MLAFITAVKRLKVLSILTLIIPTAVSASAQTFPTFSGCVKESQTLHRSSSTSGASPSLFRNVYGSFGMAFADSSTGNLSLAFSTAGHYFTTTVSGPQTIGVDSSPAAADLNGTTWVAFINNGNLWTVSYNGSSWSGPYYIPLGYSVTGQRPALLSSGGQLIVAVQSGSNIVLASGNGANFTTQYVSSAYAASSSPALSTFAGGTALVWFTGTGSAVVAKFAAGNLSSPTSVASAGGMLGGDPAAVEYNGGLFIFARSYYSSNNLWATGTLDGVNFQPWKMYGQTLTNSPGVAVSGTTLSQVGRSNFGSEIWSCVATY